MASFLLHLFFKRVTMIHTSKVYKYASYEEYRDNGMFSSEANCMLYSCSGGTGDWSAESSGRRGTAYSLLQKKTFRYPGTPRSWRTCRL